MNIFIIIYILLDLLFTKGVTRLFLIGFKYVPFKFFSFMTFAAGTVTIHRVCALVALAFILLSWKFPKKPVKVWCVYFGTAALTHGLILDAYIRGGKMIAHTPHMSVIAGMFVVACMYVWCSCSKRSCL